MQKIRASAEVISFYVDFFNVTFILFLSYLTVFNPLSVPDWSSHTLKILLVLFLYPILAYYVSNIKREILNISLHIVLVVGLYSFLFQAIAPLQHILHSGWMDDYLISLETQIFGSELSIYLEQFVSPLLTEWMMFAYVIYVPLVPGVAFVAYLSAGKIAAESYLLTLTVSYAVCFIGFVLFPVATPLFYMPEVYSVPLDGWFFTWCGEWIRENQHNPGGGLPSPHTAASTVMLFYMFKYNRRFFYILFPIIFSLYISTAYARYHYISDAILGIFVAIFVYLLVKQFIKCQT